MLVILTKPQGIEGSDVVTIDPLKVTYSTESIVAEKESKKRKGTRLLTETRESPRRNLGINADQEYAR